MKMLVESTVAENTEYFDGKKKAKKKKLFAYEGR